MNDFSKEQLIVILTTTLSLLTAWSWNSVLQKYIETYHNKTLSTTIIVAIGITVITFILINSLLNYLQVKKENIKEVQKTRLSNYVIESMRT